MKGVSLTNFSSFLTIWGHFGLRFDQFWPIFSLIMTKEVKKQNFELQIKHLLTLYQSFSNQTGHVNKIYRRCGPIALWTYHVYCDKPRCTRAPASGCDSAYPHPASSQPSAPHACVKGMDITSVEWVAYRSTTR